MRVLRGLLASLACLAGALPATAEQIVYDSAGFEEFAIGPIDNQNGWSGRTGNMAGDGAPGLPPVIHEFPDGNRAVRFEIPDVFGAFSDIYRRFMPISPGQIFEVRFDILRLTDPWSSNLWWALYDDTPGPIPFGVQWDSANGVSQTFPFGWSGPSVPTIYDRFVRVTTIYDGTTGMATAWYGGQRLGPAASPVLDTTNAWHMFLAHDEATGSGPEVAYVDNFRIRVIPEPSSGVLLILGAVAIAHRAWRRAA